MNKKRILSIALVLTVLLFTAQTAVYAGESGKTGSTSSVRVAFLDTGISTLYIDASNVAAGQNYVFPQNNTTDRVGHGTATASLVLGSVKLGIDGSCSSATAVPLVVYDTYISGVAKYGGSAMMTEAIYDAIDTYGCRVINMSIGIATDSDELRKAVEYAESKGVVIVSSVGNDNLETPDAAYYPASYPTVIGVGSANGDVAADFSQRGDSVFLLADGYHLKTATNQVGKKTKLLSGTSYSAAIVSGVVASMLTECSSLTPADVREILSKSCVDVMAEGRDNDSGYGKLDSSRAVAAATAVAGGLSVSEAIAKVSVEAGNEAVSASQGSANGENMLAELLVRLINTANAARSSIAGVN